MVPVVQNIGGLRKGIYDSSIVTLCLFAKAALYLIPTIIVIKKIGFGNRTDAYFMATAVHAMILKLLRTATFSRIYIMIFSEDYVKAPDKLKSHFNIFLNSILVVSLLISGVVYFMAPYLVHIQSLGFQAGNRNLTIHVFKWMSPLIIYSSLAALFESFFRIHSKYSEFALSTLISPLIVAICCFLKASSWDIYSIIYGNLLGSFIHLSFLMVYLWKKFGYRYRMEFDFKYSLYKKIPKLIYPYYFSTLLVQGMQMSQTFLVSFLPAGSASVFLCLLRIKTQIEDLLNSINSQILFPYFNKRLVTGMSNSIEAVYRHITFASNYVFAPLLVSAAVLSGPITEVLYSNSFTDRHLLNDFKIALGCLFLLLLPEITNSLQSNFMLALKKTLHVNIVNSSRVLIITALSFLLFHYFKFWGLIFSYFLYYIQGYVMNNYFLKKYGFFRNKVIHLPYDRLLFVNVLLLLFSYSIYKWVTMNLGAKGFSGNILNISIVMSLSAVFYYVMSDICKCNVVKTIRSMAV